MGVENTNNNVINELSGNLAIMIDENEFKIYNCYKVLCYRFNTREFGTNASITPGALKETCI